MCVASSRQRASSLTVEPMYRSSTVALLAPALIRVMYEL